MKRTLRRVGWILVGIAVREAFRTLVDAAIGRPGRLVDPIATRPAARPDPTQGDGFGPDVFPVRWPWPDSAFELGTVPDRLN